MGEFEEERIVVGDVEIAVSSGGSGPAVLLLHGFPESRSMWRTIAPILASRFFVVPADLPGYGQSSTPPSSDDHAPYLKRAMAAEMVELMNALGYSRFAVAGHDRGGRVAYRMALDHPETVHRLAVLDVLPVDSVWGHADDRMTLGFWPWSLLAQDAPLPERMLTAAADAVIDSALGPQWGTPAETFGAEDRSAYIAVLSDAGHAHAICEEYRAGAAIDRDHDREDRERHRRITCPVLALWSASGPLSSWYEDQGGPIGIWRGLADQVEGGPVGGGHFFPEEHPESTADALTRFFST